MNNAIADIGNFDLRNAVKALYCAEGELVSEGNALVELEENA